MVPAGATRGKEQAVAVGRACMPSGRMTVEWRRSHSSSCCSGAPQNTTDTNELNTTPAPYSQQMAGNAYRITCARGPRPAQAAAHGAAAPPASAALLAPGAGARAGRDRANAVRPLPQHSQPAQAAGAHALEGRGHAVVEADDAARGRRRPLAEQHVRRQHRGQHEEALAAEPHDRQRHLHQRDQLQVLRRGHARDLAAVLAQHPARPRGPGLARARAAPRPAGGWADALSPGRRDWVAPRRPGQRVRSLQTLPLPPAPPAARGAGPWPGRASAR
jgi:hypothetical protein